MMRLIQNLQGRTPAIEPRMPPRSNPYLRLASQLTAMALAGDQEICVSITYARTIPWASATFTGARHIFTLLLRGPSVQTQAERFTNSLPDAEFVLPGHIVADVALDGAHYGHNPEGGDFALLQIAALTVEDW